MLAAAPSPQQGSAPAALEVTRLIIPRYGLLRLAGTSRDDFPEKRLPFESLISFLVYSPGNPN